MRRTTSGEGLLSFLLIAAVLLACSGDAWCDSCWSRCHKETLCPGNSSPANWGYHETVYFKVNTNSAPPTLWYPEDEICAAWEQWTTCGASPPKLEYYYLGQTDKEYEEQWDEENVFAWLGDWSVTGEPANAMAVTESYWNGTMYTDCLVHEADIYFNKEYYDWYQLAAAQRQRSAVDLMSCALHEIGHTLKLCHVLERFCDGCVMAPRLYAYEIKQRLGLGDIYGVCGLYGGTSVEGLMSFEADAGDGYVHLTWEMYDLDEYYCTLYTSEDGWVYVPVYSISASGPTFEYIDYDVRNGTEYRYVLKIDGEFSSPVEALPTGSPPLATYSYLSCDEVIEGVLVEWTSDVESGSLDGYDVYRSSYWSTYGDSIRTVSSPTKMTGDPIYALGSGHTYSFTDHSASHGSKVSYLIKATGQVGDQRSGPVLNPCHRPWPPLCEVDFAGPVPDCAKFCPGGDSYGDPGPAPVSLVVTIRDSCGFPIVGFDDFHVRIVPSQEGSFLACCWEEQPTVPNGIQVLPDGSTDENGQATVNITWGGGCDRALSLVPILDARSVEFGSLPTLQVRSPDVNGDCEVGLIDYTLFASHFGSSEPEAWIADLNCDGTVDMIDFSVFASHYGHTCGSKRTLDVPEEWPFSDPDGAVLSLENPRPNPSVGSTTFSYVVPEPGGHLRLSVYNAAGQRVAELVDAHLPAGEYSVGWNGCGDDGSMVSSGVYFCRGEMGTESVARKLILLR